MSWLPLAFAITGLCGLAYLLVQQSYRQSLNDPQIQMAEDAAMSLAAGADPGSVLPGSAIEMTRSLAPYLAVYDDAGQPLAFSGTLNGQAPVPPAGVFDSARARGETRITWQPQAGVRSAIVLSHYNGIHPGFVLAGRGMREVELREDKAFLLAGGAWVVLLIVTLAIHLFAGTLKLRA